VTAENPSDISRMRISDADRDRAASVLNTAMAEGRLTPEEHSQRLDAVFAAKTQADITPLISDIPGANASLATSPGSLARTGGASLAATGGSPSRMISVFSAVTRKGVWQVPQQIEAVSVFGETDLDLREAVLPPGEIRIRAISVLGGIDIVVPPEMHVIDDGWALLGGREIPPDTQESLGPDAPVLRVTGLSILGGMTVKRKRRKRDKPQDRQP
jgi:hypothetical protein